MSTSRDAVSSQPKQKVVRQTSMMGTITNILNQGPMQPVSVQNRMETDEYSPIFYQEISDIMRGFGDCEKPLKESVILIDKILLHQLRGILQDVIDLAVQRKDKPEPTLKDFYFLMRNNPVKMFRLQKHIRDIQLKKKFQEMMVMEGRPIISYQDELDTNGINSDDEMDREIPEKYDEEKLRRLFRADRISLSLNGNQYKEFNEARRTSFYCRNSSAIRSKLREWLQAPNEVKISNQVFTILSYLAHETIATIVDFCILTRLDSSNRQTEPYSRITSSGGSYNMLHSCPEVTQGRGLDGIKPITVQEIHEAMRRHTMSSSKTIGLYRNIDGDGCIPYLAI